MPTITEGIFEDGVLKLVDVRGLEEQRRYRVIVEEIAAPVAPHDPALAAELARRTTALPGGGVAVRLGGLFAPIMDSQSDTTDSIADELEQLRREREERFNTPSIVPAPD